MQDGFLRTDLDRAKKAARWAKTALIFNSDLTSMYVFQKSSWDFIFLHISVVSFQISVGLFAVVLDMIKIL